MVVERSIFSAKALYGERKVFLLLLYSNKLAMMFVVHCFHRHRSLTLKYVLLLTADTNSSITISNSFIPPIKLKHCLWKCVSCKLPFSSNFVSMVGFVSCSNEHQVNSNNQTKALAEPNTHGWPHSCSDASSSSQNNVWCDLNYPWFFDTFFIAASSATETNIRWWHCARFWSMLHVFQPPGCFP